jgi:pimeloyl-ACP methyl ester carboxylesterase
LTGIVTIVNASRGSTGNTLMMFSDPVHDEFAAWALGFAPYGGGDVGEVEYLATKVKQGDDDSFFDEFSAFARRRIDEGDLAATRGHRATARDCYMRAAALIGIAYHPIYGTPVDTRLVDAFHLQMDTFDKAVALTDPPGEKIDVPYEGTTLPAYFLRAPGHENDVRPVILVGGGWDSTVVENHLGIGAAALQRGYHVLLHDGPGQGRLLIDEGIPLRYDWEKVLTPVFDAALRIDVVDPDRIVYEPWSLGGYFAPRAAAFEHRLAGIIADPGQLDVGGKFAGAMKLFGLSDVAVAKLPELDPDDEQRVMKVIEGDRSMRWKIVQRGFWTNGATGMSSWLAEMDKWKLDTEAVAAIKCPTLVTAAEDMASSNAKDLYDALSCPKVFIQFSSADGAGMHCEILNRSMANRQILDWLDDALAPAKH